MKQHYEVPVTGVPLQEPRGLLAAHPLTQHLHQSRFPNPRLSAQQNDLPLPLADLVPALQEQPH